MRIGGSFQLFLISPPPDVPAIEPDIRGATTIREQLEKHRADASCAECHRKIDPLGFALENFDAIGGWRDQYGMNLPIKLTGQLTGGSEFATVPEFRQQLMQREDEFVRCLTKKLMMYALGREIEVGDRPAIDSLLEELETTKGGLQDLIRLIILSEPFLTN